ncbi:MAG: endonuclease III domain-containing protein [Mariprofundaceae bacterium]|nr:endonuclease III domain-containing protein [Mariprofundaceae bacterium]
MNALAIYRLLRDAYGPQHWWPADSPFEVMLGAILTQNTNWRNVELAIANLKTAEALHARVIMTLDESHLQQLIRPSGFFRQKAERLRLFCAFYLEHGGEQGIRTLPEPRSTLLALKGIGPETADSILLYALELPAFVVDAYTRRIFSRLGLLSTDVSYDETQGWFSSRLPADTQLFNEYHALIVQHAKQHCRVKPACGHCPLSHICPYRLQA